jgi:aldose sugar dehydrogenase
MSRKKLRSAQVARFAAAVGLVAAGCSGGERADAPRGDRRANDSERSAEAAQDSKSESPDSESLDEQVFPSEYAAIRVVRIAGPFEHPWAVAFLPDGHKLVTERPGRIFLVDGDGARRELSGAPEVRAQSQGGLLDIAVHPDFEENGWIYLTYSKPAEEGADTATALARGVLDVDAGALEELEDLFVQNRYSEPGRHYGSRLAFTPDGKLLMSVGDRGAEPPRAQDLSDHAGTLLRLEDDGSPVADNPFVGDGDAADEIYSYGHRNIQGLVVASDGTIWVTDHGPRGGDLLQRVEAGNNYGWPVVTQGLNYRDQGTFPHAEARSREGIEPPYHEFFITHAPSGLALVTSGAFETWQGDLLAGGLRGERLRRLVLGDDGVLHEEELIAGAIGRIRDVREGPDGNLYVLTDAREGALYRIEPAG